FAVADAVSAHRHTVKAKPFFGITRDLPPAELAVKRLQLFLNGPDGIEGERRRAGQALAELRVAMDHIPAGFTGATIPPLTVPTGPPADLLRKAGDAQTDPVDRAAAAVGAGLALEKARA